jgi:hypothetical protein
MSGFFDFWKSRPYEMPRFEKNMSDRDLAKARATIEKMGSEGKPSSMIIKHLERQFGLSEGEASRVFWTEQKRIDTKEVASLGKELGFDKYKIVLSPSACNKCRQITQNGSRVFSQKEFSKAGYGHVPPFHPFCYCIALPYVE